MSSSGSLAETSLPSIFILSLALCFHVAKVRIYFGPCKQNAKKPVFFGGIFHPIFTKKYPLNHILSFLTPPSTAPGRSVQENFPHGAGKFLAPCADALSYIHRNSAKRTSVLRTSVLFGVFKMQGTYIKVYIIYILYIPLIIIHNCKLSILTSCA